MSTSDKNPLPSSFLLKQEEDAKYLNMLRSMTKPEFDAHMARSDDKTRKYCLALIECGQMELLDEVIDKTKTFPQVKKLLDDIWKESDNA